MKIAVLAVLGLATLVSGRSVDFEDLLEDITSYGYHDKIGIPLANKIRAAEEAALASGSRIVGGSPARLGQFPYQVGILITLWGGTGMCGGSLLNSYRVLTAAHCWWDGFRQARLFTMIFESTQFFTGGQRQSTMDITMHGSWNPSTTRNDIAIVGLPLLLRLNNNVQPIALPSGSQLNENFAGAQAVASGFGATRDGASITLDQNLNHVTLEVLSNAVCQRTQDFGHIIVDTHLCTSGTGRRGTCHGDSGGPLVVTRNNRPLLIGITSFGHISGCELGFPSVFTRVTHYDSWVRSRM